MTPFRSIAIRAAAIGTAIGTVIGVSYHTTTIVPVPVAMHASARCLDIIKDYEKLSLTAYKPTPNDVWTIGWGHTRGVRQGDTITQEQADIFLREDVRDAEDTVNALGVEMSQAQFDALVSFVYNVGPDAVRPSSTVGRAIRRQDWFVAWRGMALWTKQAGNDLRGLARRRSSEMLLFMEDPFHAGGNA